MTPGAARLVILIAALAGVGLTASLGRWQLHRADDKLARQGELTQRQRLAALRNPDWPCLPADLPSSTSRIARLRGHWLHAYTVYLDNRPMDGQSGFEVITPLELDPAGSSPGAMSCPTAVVLVQRGWIPRDAADRTRVLPVPTPSGPVEVAGRVLTGASQVYQLGVEPDARPEKGPIIRQNVALAWWATWLGHAPRPGMLLQLGPELPLAPSVALSNAGPLPTTATTASAPGSSFPALKRHWPEPSTGVGKHHAYAAQWFALAALISGLYVWFQILRPRRAPGA